MKKAWKFICIGIAVILVSSVFAVLPVSAGDSEASGMPLMEFPRNEMAPDGFDPMDLTVEDLGEEEIAIREYAAEVGSAVATYASPIGLPAEVGDEFVFTVSDDYLGIEYDEEFVVLMDGTHGIILIEKAAYDNYDAVTDEYVFPNPNGCWRAEDRIPKAPRIPRRSRCHSAHPAPPPGPAGARSGPARA